MLMMIANINHKLKHTLFLFIAVWLSACSVQTPATMPATSEIEAFFTSAPNMLPVKTEIPSVTETAVITKTTSYNTPTVYLTMNAQDAQLELSELLEDNGGCRLPCWWGMTPGVTLWRDVEPYLASFADDLMFAGKVTLEKYYQKIPLEHYRFSKKLEGQPEDIEVVFSINPDDILEMVTSRAPTTEANFRVSQLLVEYGVPEEILLGATSNYPPGNTTWFWLMFYYPQDGFAAYYEGEAEKIGDEIIVCPNTIGPQLFLFDEEKMTLGLLEYMVDHIFWGESSGFPSINTYPDLTVEILMENLIDPSGCIRLPDLK